MICLPQVTQIELILKHNIETLLEVRGMKKADLVRMLPSKSSATGRRTQAYISRILNPPPGNPTEQRSMRLPDVERVAKVFGLAPHELLNPGISRYTERRSGVDRRSNTDRRKKDVKSLIPELEARLNRGTLAGSSGDSSVRYQAIDGGDDPGLRRLIERHERELNAYIRTHFSEGIGAGTKGPSSPARRPRKVSGSHA